MMWRFKWMRLKRMEVLNYVPATGCGAPVESRCRFPVICDGVAGRSNDHTSSARPPDEDAWWGTGCSVSSL